MRDDAQDCCVVGDKFPNVHSVLLLPSVCIVYRCPLLAARAVWQVKAAIKWHEPDNVNRVERLAACMSAADLQAGMRAV